VGGLIGTSTLPANAAEPASHTAARPHARTIHFDILCTGVTSESPFGVA
jgi:hypothetical protein